MFQNPDDRYLFKELSIIPQNKPTVVTNGSGVDLTHYSSSPVPHGNPVFMCISRLLKEKGVREFAEAALQLKNKYPLAKFKLVGPHDHGPDSISDDLLVSWQNGGLDWVGPVDDVRDELKNALFTYCLHTVKEHLAQCWKPWPPVDLLLPLIQLGAAKLLSKERTVLWSRSKIFPHLSRPWKDSSSSRSYYKVWDSLSGICSRKIRC